MDPQDWEARYRSRDRLFSGNPNGVLVAEAADLAPGRALDVGCGEGGDAIWLARRGWRVTAVDVAQTALDRGAGAAAAAGVADRVTWARTDVTVTAPAAAAYDLVTAQYLPLPRQPGHAALRGLLDAVAPAGTFLFAGHDLADLTPREGFDPTVYYQPAEIAALLDDDWTVLVDETRARTVPPPPGSDHTHDTILRAQRGR